MKMRKKNKSISVRVFLSFTAIALFSFFLVAESIISRNVYLDIVDQKTGEIYQNDLLQVTDNIAFEFGQINQIIANIIRDNEQEQFCSKFQAENNI